MPYTFGGAYSGRHSVTMLPATHNTHRVMEKASMARRLPRHHHGSMTCDTIWRPTNRPTCRLISGLGQQSRLLLQRETRPHPVPGSRLLLHHRSALDRNAPSAVMRSESVTGSWPGHSGIRLACLRTSTDQCAGPYCYNCDPGDERNVEPRDFRHANTFFGAIFTWDCLR